MSERKPLVPGRFLVAAKGAKTYTKAGAYTRHCSAQLEPFLIQKHTRNTHHTPYHPLNTPEATPQCTPCHAEGA